MNLGRTAIPLILGSICLVAFLSFPRFLVTLVPVYGVGELAEQVSSEETDDQIVKAEISTSTLYVLGDVMLARHVEAHMIKSGASYPYKGVPFLADGDAYVLANFEAAVPANHIKTANFAMRFSVNREFLPALHEAGVTHLGLANNHTLDYGVEGFANLKNALYEAGFNSFGQPGIVSTTSVSYLELGHGVVALIALENITKELNRDELVSLLRTAEGKSDLQIAYIHWGPEYVVSPHETQMDLARELALLGVDLIIGHHPHVVQGIKMVEGVPVFYSLGNFIFDQYFSREVQEGLVLRLDATRDGIIISGLPVTSLSVQAQPRLMTDSDAKDFYDGLREVSDEGLLHELQYGKLMVPWPLATFKETVMMSQ